MNLSRYIRNCTIKISHQSPHPLSKFFTSLILFAGIACSPAVVVLEHKPELAKSTYRYFADRSEKLIAISPENPERLIDGCETLTKYAFGFTMEEADRLVMEDYKGGKLLHEKANQTFAKAVAYGDRALSIKYPTYYDWLLGRVVAMPEFDPADTPYLFWTAGAYGGAIKSSGGNPEWVILLPRVGRLLEAGLSVDPNWNKGALYSAMISYTISRHDAPKNKAEIARDYFEKAVKSSNGQDLGPYVTMAESVSIATQNKNEFTNLLYKALNIDIKADPDLRLTNHINRNRAQWLLDNIDEFFY
ncbi:MAG: TRAP transporter TatT component family protein [Candidatus Marinimicrobia bacterium]|nr:TRAP transporter TatT component family protein [Candidatus Neomarinimicrobiota bacterium]MDP6611981.1 TRAP transporter TatT component family protein [Candidatus Neomarinimicrobiota bacterium]